MKKAMNVLAALAILLLWGTCVSAQQEMSETVPDGCREDVEKNCGHVTPGDGRIAACLKAHGQKISEKCEFALYSGPVEHERGVSATTYLATECDSDIQKYCETAELGGGRVLECLKKQDKALSERCRAAMKDVGVK